MRFIRLIRSFIHSFVASMRDVKRARILKRARCICVMFVRARCNVSHRASVRKNALLFSPARRSSSFSAAARRVQNALLFENATHVFSFPSLSSNTFQIRTARDSRVGQRAERSVTVGHESIERPIESSNAEGFDASMRASRWAMDGRASRCGTRAAPGPGSGLGASVAHPRAPRGPASALRLGTVVKRGAARRASWRPCLSRRHLVIAFSKKLAR